MNGLSIIPASVVAASPGTAWQLKGAGDLDGDAIWELHGSTILAAGVVGPTGTDWEVIA